MQRELHIGLMSGTSLDGVDGVLASFPAGGDIELLAHAHAPFDPELRAELLALNQPGNGELHRAALAANALARAYAAVTDRLALPQQQHRDGEGTHEDRRQDGHGPKLARARR